MHPNEEIVPRYRTGYRPYPPASAQEVPNLPIGLSLSLGFFRSYHDAVRIGDANLKESWLFRGQI